MRESNKVTIRTRFSNKVYFYEISFYVAGKCLGRMILATLFLFGYGTNKKGSLKSQENLR